MTTNRLATSDGRDDDKKYAKCPPGMPRGDSPADKAARLRFWVDYGNNDLALKGRTDVRWYISNGELRLDYIWHRSEGNA